MSKTDRVWIPQEEFTVLTEPYMKAELKANYDPDEEVTPVDVYLRVNFNDFMTFGEDLENDYYTGEQLVEYQDALLSRRTVHDEDWLQNIQWEVVGFLSGDLILHVVGYVEKSDLEDPEDLDAEDLDAEEAKA